ncbi:MAG: molybdenum cofactor guanylyltransferase [Cyanobacteriota bacterium]
MLPQPATQPTSPQSPLRCCLLSGGASRRMGRDKALLPHPQGGCWLERSLRLLAHLHVPITLMSRWPAHLERAAPLVGELAANGVSLELLLEPPPSEGPLLALGRLMERYPQQRLLLCPVDMPALDEANLRALEGAAAGSAGIWISRADRPQPLLGIYPSDPDRRHRLGQALAAGERSLQRWLAGEEVQQLPLGAAALANVNTPEELRNLTISRT